MRAIGAPQARPSFSEWEPHLRCGIDPFDRGAQPMTTFLLLILFAAIVLSRPQPVFARLPRRRRRG